MTPTELIRVLMAVLAGRGLDPVLRTADLREAHEAAGTLLRLLGVAVWREPGEAYRSGEDDGD
ncbi:hypothetical protein [Micromonospora aurantiaca (nom. illeg.)]|uniref:hypothetical protein n=1 Tax=Micromonospora aurantiaca (nom. illeg.) TaxID=47850 RepID=UPI003F4A11B2